MTVIDKNGNPDQVITSERLWHLVKGFWSGNKNLPDTSLNRLRNHLHTILREFPTPCPLNLCQVPCKTVAPHELLSILVHRLQLQVEGIASALHRSTEMREWCSPDKIDKEFGARGPLLEQDLAGYNTFILLSADNGISALNQVHARMTQWTTSRSPRELSL